MKKIIIILLFLSTLNLSAQDREEYRSLDITSINEELKNNKGKISFNEIFSKYCKYIPKDYKVDGQDSYHTSTLNSLTSVSMHITDMKHPLLKELKVQYKVTDKDGYYQFIELQESYLCKNSEEWSAEPCEA